MAKKKKHEKQSDSFESFGFNDCSLRMLRAQESQSTAPPNHREVGVSLVTTQGELATSEVFFRIARAGLAQQIALRQYPMETNLSPAQVLNISKLIWEQFGVRHFLFDIFSDPKLIDHILMLNSQVNLNNRSFLNYSARLSYSILDHTRFLSEYALYSDFTQSFSKYLVRDNDGSSKIYSLSVQSSARPTYDSFLYTQSQAKAIKSLSQAIRIARGGVKLGGVEARTHVFVVGVSGSGKTTAIKQAALNESLPVFSHNLPSWIVTGARSEPTLSILSNWVQAHPEGGVINIDEIEKIPVGKEENNYSWFTAVRAEILKLLDCDMQGFDSYFPPSAIDTLRKCVVVGSGNFQQLYSHQISRDANLSYAADCDDSYLCQEISNLLPVTVDDLREGKYLPEEIITRFSPYLVEVRVPTVEELSGYLSNIDVQAGVFRSDNQVMAHAKNIFVSGQAFRGLENYVFSLLEKRDEIYRENLE